MYEFFIGAFYTNVAFRFRTHQVCECRFTVISPGGKKLVDVDDGSIGTTEPVFVYGGKKLKTRYVFNINTHHAHEELGTGKKGVNDQRPLVVEVIRTRFNGDENPKDESPYVRRLVFREGDHWPVTDNRNGIGIMAHHADPDENGQYKWIPGARAYEIDRID